MKKALRLFLFLICILLFAITAKAELSTNLQIQKEMKPKTNLTARETYVDSQGNPVVASDKGYATVTYTYNGVNLMETNFLDVEGNLVNSVDGYSTIKYEYKLRAVIKTAYFNATGEPILGPEGYSVQEIVRGTKGLELENYKYDAEGKLLIHCVTEYVDIKKDNLIKSKSWYNDQGEPIPGPDGYAKVAYEYFKRKKCRITYYNPDGSHYYYLKAGYAEKEQIYEKGNISELNYYGEGRMPIPGPDGYSSAKYTYAQGGKEILTMYYNADGTPYFTKQGYCGIKQVKENRRVIDESYYKGEGIRGMSNDGYSRTTRRYTLRSQIIQQCYYDENDHLMIPEEIGYAKIKNTYSTRFLLKTEYFDENEQPSYCADGYSVAIYEYKDKLRIGATFYDKDGKTVINGKYGYAKIVYLYDDNKQNIGEVFLDKEGNSIAVFGEADEVRFTQDSKGNKTSESYWKNGEPVNGEKGYHEIRIDYTKDNKIKKESYYGIDGKPVNSINGYAAIEKLYNSQKQVMATLYYNENDQLINTPGQEYAYMLTITEKDKKALTPEDEEEEETEEDNTDEEEEEENTPSSTIYVEYYGTDRKLMNRNIGYAYIIRKTDSKGRAIQENYYDKDGNRAVLTTGYDELRKEYIDGKKPYRTEYYLNRKPVLYDDNYAAVEREYDESGNVIAEQYYNTDFQPAPCKNGYEAIRKEYNENNQVIAEAYYDHNGLQMTNKKGVYQTAYGYNENGKVAIEGYMDAEGKPMLCADGYAGWERLYNEKGSTVATLYYNEAGELMLRPGKEYAYMITTSKAEKEGTVEKEDGSSQTFYVEYYGTDRKLMNLAAGYASIIRTIDEQGRIIGEIYLDKDGNRALSKGEYDEIRQAYTDNNKPSRIEYYLNDAPVLRSDGYAAVEREYDEDGYVITEKYYDIVFQPAPCNKGYEMIRKEYNEDKRISKEAYYDRNGQPMTDNKGVYQTTYEYNENGKIKKETYYDSEGKTMNCPAGYAGMGKMYNSQGVAIATLYYSETGELIQTPGKEYAYIITTPKAEKDGSAEEEDGSNKSVYTDYYGTDGKLMMLSSGYASILRTTDEQGRTVREVYFDQNGQRTDRGKDFDEYRRTYTDNTNNPSRIEYYLNGRPVLRADGYAAVEREYDEDGYVIQEKYYDTQFQPASCNKGYEMIRREYDEDKRITKEAYFDHNEEPMINNRGVYQTVYEYNENGKQTKETYYDSEGNPMNCLAGYAGVERMYNSQSSTIAKLYYNEAGELIQTPGKEYAYIITTPKAERDGTAEEEDRSNKSVYVDYYGTDGKLMMLSSGYASILRTTDELGRTVGEIYFDQDGQRAILRNTYDEIRRSYTDDTNRPGRTEFYLNGEPALREEGYAAVEREYDTAGNIITERYYDTEFNPVPRSNGYEMIKNEYNEQRQVVKEAYFDHAGEPMVNNRGVYQTAYEYNEQGKVIKETYYDADGQPMSNIKGYNMVVREYDEQGNKIRETGYPQDEQQSE